MFSPFDSSRPASAATLLASGMKFGIATFVTDESIGPARLGKELEARGFDSVFLAEHSHIPVDRASPYPSGGKLPRKYYRTLDPFVALTAMASATTDLLLGTGIALLPQRDLIHTAKEVASVDLVSGGRMLFGVGVGWNREEMRNHGTEPRTRGARMDEMLAALTEIWTKDEAQFHGTFVEFDPIYSWPKPVQQPHPPIFVGGESDAALARLVAFGDAWLPRSDTTPQRLRDVRAWLTEQGRVDVPFTIFAAGKDPGQLEGYAEAGVERVTLLLETLPESEALAELDLLARLAFGT
jgi:probable F420-dependent oxidoreductase